jgi:purine-binding chemotaxis protein CheW
MTSLALVCRSGAMLLALPLDAVAETLRTPPVQALADQPRFVRGVAIVRGAPLPVVDVAALLGGPAGAQAARLVTLKLGPRRVGLALDAVLGVRPLDAERLHDVPPLLQQASSDLLGGMAALDDELLLALRGAVALPPSVWDEIDSRRPQ